METIYTLEKLKEADKMSKMFFNCREDINKKVFEFISTWGQDFLSNEGFFVDANISPIGEITIDIVTPLEFGARLSVKYTPDYGEYQKYGKECIEFEHPATGYYTVKNKPKHRQIVILYGRILEDYERFEEQLRILYNKVVPNYMDTCAKLEDFKKDNPGLMGQYFESDMYKNRKDNEN